MPDRRVVIVEPRTDDGSLLKALPAPGPRLDSLYTLSIRKGKKLLGREVRVVDIQPRDAYRYGYRLWLDEETAMPLRSIVVGSDGQPVELIHFARLETDSGSNGTSWSLRSTPSGFQWIRAGKRAEPRAAAAVAGWRPLKCRPGSGSSRAGCRSCRACPCRSST